MHLLQNNNSRQLSQENQHHVYLFWNSTLFTFRLHSIVATPNSEFELGIQIQEFIYLLDKYWSPWSANQKKYGIFVFK